MIKKQKNAHFTMSLNYYKKKVKDFKVKKHKKSIKFK